MSDDIERLTEQVAQLTAVLNELREQGHAHLAVMRTAATETQLANERAQRQSKATEDNFKALGQKAVDTSAQLQKSFQATAVAAGHTLAGEMGASFGKQANRDLGVLARRLEQAIAQTQAVGQQQRAGWRWMAWGGYGVGALMTLLLAGSVWWNMELRADRVALIEQLTEARQALAPNAAKLKPKTGMNPSVPEKPPTGAR